MSAASAIRGFAGVRAQLAVRGREEREREVLGRVGERVVGGPAAKDARGLEQRDEVPPARDR